MTSQQWRTPQRRAGSERRITDALLATVPTGMHGRDWPTAHPYLRTYLARHALAAGPNAASALAQDTDFLAAADPATRSPLLSVRAASLQALRSALVDGYLTPVIGPLLDSTILGPSRENIARDLVERWRMPIAPHNQGDLAKVAQYLSIRSGEDVPRVELLNYLASYYLRYLTPDSGSL